ncbi:helix-turn-helix domain-containing protein [Celeribacter sp. SCSIO 80788]|uniref:helix-turn-helix domain-containing protein n=1 Tax=Celeribacter sp. SCSIO 80788 TaxID=3117013 RepID=UPI003DA51849
MPEKLLTIPEVATRMSLSARSIRRLIADREIRYISVGRRKLVPHEAIKEFYDRNMVTPRPAEGGDGVEY